MARSRVSYAEAVRLLLGGTDPVDVVGRVAGGAMLAAAPFATETVLSWFDAKGEANNLLRELLGRAPARIRAARGKRHYELIEAAHAVLVLSAFFESVEQAYGPQLAALELTDDEKQRIGTTSPLAGIGEAASMPGATSGFDDNLPSVESALSRMASSFGEFVRGLAAGRDMPGLDDTDVQRAAAIYRERYVRLAADVPEFAIWSQLDEHAATRAEIRRHDETLARLEQILTRIVDAPTPAVEAERRLANHAAEVLRRPVWRGEASGISFPTVEEGFISPRFRLARFDKESRLADDNWWATQDEYANLTDFLSGYLTDPASTEQPLVVLGTPGAGKSLLTKVLAARLPPEVFTTFRVPLRRVDPGASIHRQVEEAAERLIHEHQPWADLCRTSDTTKVVLLDGFDELIQATEAKQSDYLHRAARFQQEEWINGRSVAVVVTSRTLVMDRIAVPDGTLVVKLEPFDDQQIERWLATWNAANRHHAAVRELTADALPAELADQPLLLLMLAIYAASGETQLGTEEFSSEEDLYKRLLDSFIRRQIRDKTRSHLAEPVLLDLERESRRDLATVAFAMFNRGHQWVSEDDLSADLRALHDDAGASEPGPGGSATRAERTITGFFFVHTARSGREVRVPGRQTYEFMHATFGEYLIAEQTAALLGNLVDDWNASRGRLYGSALPDRALRALLSHQPLSNRERILPFLAAILGRMEPESRDNLRQALLELFRGSRKRVPDDPYRPTPFDAVNRVACYTANLVLLATLCAPDDGLPVAALSERAPSLESTVRLWRSGLGSEAQRTLFNRLTRAGEGLRVEDLYVRYNSLPVAEAELIGDRKVELVLKTGERYLPHLTQYEEEDPTPFQRDIHIEVVNIALERWSSPLLSRLLPRDEALYTAVADRAEGVDEPLAADTAELLVQLLTDEGRRLPGALADRLVRAISRPELAGQLQPRLSMLALSRLELFKQHPEIMSGITRTNYSALLYELALRAREDGSPEAQHTAGQLAERLVLHDGVEGIGVDVLPSMVRNLVFAPGYLSEAIWALESYGSISWKQVTPTDLLAATAIIDMTDRETRRCLSIFVADREGDEFGEDERAALEEIRRRVRAAEPGSDR